MLVKWKTIGAEKKKAMQREWLKPKESYEDVTAAGDGNLVVGALKVQLLQYVCMYLYRGICCEHTDPLNPMQSPFRN